MADNHPSFEDTWYPINTAPTDGLMILAKTPDGVEELVWYDITDRWQTTDGRHVTPIVWRYTRKDQYLRWQQAK